jgi:DNA polymerase III delta prime subunit
MDSNQNEFLWAQKYRPRVVDECILPEATKTLVKDLIAKNEVTHMLFSGGPGMGKTTLAYAIANELDSDVLYINAALEAGIDLMRTKVMQFASTVSLSDTGPKIVIMDEADGIKIDAQNGLKAFLEQFSSNCRFIFTCNVKHKIIEPIRSRCLVVDFSFESNEKQKIAAAFYKRIVNILEQENVQFDKKTVAKLVEKNFPDFRKTLNELQRYSVSGVIDSGILVNHTEETFAPLFEAIVKKDFASARKWVGQNDDIDPALIFRTIFEVAEKKMQKQSIASLILILADYGYKSAFCVDQQVNTMACILEVMTNCVWED